MSELILRLTSRWYDPAEQVKRERRTDTAHQKAIAIRRRSEAVGRSVEITRESYEEAGKRLAHR